MSAALVSPEARWFTCRAGRQEGQRGLQAGCMTVRVKGYHTTIHLYITTVYYIISITNLAKLVILHYGVNQEVYNYLLTAKTPCTLDAAVLPTLSRPTATATTYPAGLPVSTTNSLLPTAKYELCSKRRQAEMR